MVNMTHRPNIHMGLRTLELRLTHGSIDSNVVESVSDLWVVKELEPLRSLAADTLHDV
jgi:hypothetical protein